MLASKVKRIGAAKSYGFIEREADLKGCLFASKICSLMQHLLRALRCSAGDVGCSACDVADFAWKLCLA